jgi:hypothetical protein
VESAESVKTAVSGLAPFVLAFAVIASVVEPAPAGIVTATGMSPWGRR